MSCYIVEPETVGIIAATIAHNMNSSDYRAVQTEDLQRALVNCYSAGIMDQHKVYRTLYIMNLRAYNGRYNENVKEFAKYSYTAAPVTLEGKIRAYKALNCYLYQCAEDATAHTDLYNALRVFEKDFASAIVRSLPEYENANSWR